MIWLLIAPLALFAAWIAFDLAGDNIAGAFTDGFDAIKDFFRP